MKDKYSELKFLKELQLPYNDKQLLGESIEEMSSAERYSIGNHQLEVIFIDTIDRLAVTSIKIENDNNEIEVRARIFNDDTFYKRVLTKDQFLERYVVWNLPGFNFHQYEKKMNKCKYDGPTW